MKIAYLLLTHKNERQIKRLIGRLRTGSDSFVLVHHDYSKGTPLVVRNASDVHVLRDYVPVTWAHISVALAMLRGIQWLEEQRIEFDWLIILSGQDYPVQSLSHTESYLKTTLYDAFIQSYHIHENTPHTLFLHRYFHGHQHPYRGGVECYAGSNWLNLSRTATEYLWSKKDMIDGLVSYLEGTQSPVETLFHTVLLNSVGLNIANDDKRFILWKGDAAHPELLCTEHLRAMVESGAFFARKFDDTVCPEVLDQLDEATTNPGSSGAANSDWQTKPARGKAKLENKSSVSVITIFLDEERFIEEAIESVLAQRYDNWELLLVDDGSTDRSTQIALRYAERYPEKVRYLEHPGHENRGMSASRNLGIANAKGEYIAFLDADDVWLPHKLQQQVEILNTHPEAGMVYGLSQYWHSWSGNPEDEERDDVPELRVRADKLYEPPTLLTLLYPLGVATAPPPSDILLRCETVKRLGGFEEDFVGMRQMYEDQAFLTKVYLKEPVFVANARWDRYRLHPDSCCAIVERAGQYDSVRLFFLNWLAARLTEERVKDAEVWVALHEALRPYGKSSILAEAVEIREVGLSAPDPERLWGRNIELPQHGSLIDGYLFDLIGWVLGKGSPVVAVEVVHEGNVVRRVPLTIPRPDIEEAFPDVPGAAQSGFRTSLSIMEVPAREFELRVHAILQDGSRVSIGAIRARRC